MQQTRNDTFALFELDKCDLITVPRLILPTKRKSKFFFIVLTMLLHSSLSFSSYSYHMKSKCLQGQQMHSDVFSKSKKYPYRITNQITHKKNMQLHLDPSITCTIDSILDPIQTMTIAQNPSIQLGKQIYDSYGNTPYLFMFPIATMVATSCQLAGIGGAALFSPIFLLLFPILHLELSTPAQAVASALLTEVFGFASGLYGYSKRGLVDWAIAKEFMMWSIPSAFIGGIVAKIVSEDEVLLRCLYAALMIGLSLFLTFSPKPDVILDDEACILPEKDDNALRTLIATDGTEYTYFMDPMDSNINAKNVQNVGATVAGSTLTGLLGVGVGEVILPQLVRGRCMPLAVAAGTSVAVVVTTALTAAIIQFSSLALSLTNSAPVIDGQQESMNVVTAFITVIPWKLVQCTIPGVLIGGQLAPFIASSGFISDEKIERFAAALFAIIGIAFAVKAVIG